MKRWMFAPLLLLALAPAAATTPKKTHKKSAPTAKTQAAKAASAKKSATAAKPSTVAKAGSAAPVSGKATAKSGAVRQGVRRPLTLGRAQVELAQVMARNARLMGEQLPVPQRVALLSRLLYTLPPETMAGEKQQWASELFALAWQLPQESAEQYAARNAVMATAAARMAVYDPERALAMLDNQPVEKNALGDQADARCMAARLVFASYMKRHGAAGASALLTHARRWSEQGSFPYGATGVVLEKLRAGNDAAEDYFREELEVFQQGREGLFGVSEFASLLQQAASMEAIYEDTAEAAGGAVLAQVTKLAADSATLTPRQRELVVKTMNDVRMSAPKAWAAAQQSVPELTALRAEHVTAPEEELKVDADLQAAFRELASTLQSGSGEEVKAAIARGLKLVNAKYQGGLCASCTAPEAQSWALVSLAAHASPATIAAQLAAVEDPYWHAYFLVIAAQQVGVPSRVADPTARLQPGKEEAETE